MGVRAVSCLLVVSAAALVGCSAHHAAEPAQAAGPSVVRFWSVPGHPAGSTIDASHADTGLHPDQDVYCGILRSTAGAPPTSTNGASALTTVQAWVTDLQATAPDQVKAAWQIEGPALIRLAGGSVTSSADTAAVQQAGKAISAHAKSTCGVALTG